MLLWKRDENVWQGGALSHDAEHLICSDSDNCLFCELTWKQQFSVSFNMIFFVVVLFCSFPLITPSLLLIIMTLWERIVTLSGKHGVLSKLLFSLSSLAEEPTHWDKRPLLTWLRLLWLPHTETYCTAQISCNVTVSWLRRTIEADLETPCSTVFTHKLKIHIIYIDLLFLRQVINTLFWRLFDFFGWHYFAYCQTVVMKRFNIIKTCF